MRHISQERELAWKLTSARQVLERYGPAYGGSVDVVSPGVRRGHRVRGRFRVQRRPDGQGVVMGLRQVGLGDGLVDIRGCVAQSARFTQVMGAVGAVLDALGAEATGSVESVEVRTSDRDALAIVQSSAPMDLGLKEALVGAAKTHGFSLLGQVGDETPTMFHGKPSLQVQHGRWTVETAPGSWTHASPLAGEGLLTWLRSRIEGQGHRDALDLCCATGTVTFDLLEQLEGDVVAVDADRAAVLSVKEAAGGLERLETRAGKLSVVLRKLRRRTPALRPTLAVVNPMRKVLGERELKDLRPLGVRQVIYLGPAAASAAKDAAVLAALGYHLHGAAVIDLHPGTAQFMLGLDLRTQPALTGRIKGGEEPTASHRYKTPKDDQQEDS